MIKGKIADKLRLVAIQNLADLITNVMMYTWKEWIMTDGVVVRGSQVSRTDSESDFQVFIGLYRAGFNQNAIKMKEL